MQCEICNGKRFKETEVIGVRECKKCKALTGTCCKGDSYRVVKPWMINSTEEIKGKQAYYDIKTLGSEGIGRRHGWYDTETRLIIQAG